MSNPAYNTVHFPLLIGTWVSDTIRFAFIGAGMTPSVNDSDPRWGAGGVQDYSAFEVYGGQCPQGGAALTGKTSTLVNNVRSLNAASPVVAYGSNAGNPSAARYGVYYNVTQANKVIRFVNLNSGADLSLSPGIQENFNSTGSGTQPASTATNN